MIAWELFLRLPLHLLARPPRRDLKALLRRPLLHLPVALVERAECCLLLLLNPQLAADFPVLLLLLPSPPLPTLPLPPWAAAPIKTCPPMRPCLLLRPFRKALLPRMPSPVARSAWTALPSPLLKEVSQCRTRDTRLTYPIR